eukprot:9080416-Pyramimonas_sp.AAC.1
MVLPGMLGLDREIMAELAVICDIRRGYAVASLLDDDGIQCLHTELIRVAFLVVYLVKKRVDLLDCLFAQQQSPAIRPWCAAFADLRARSHIVIARYCQLPNIR